MCVDFFCCKYYCYNSMMCFSQSTSVQFGYCEGFGWRIRSSIFWTDKQILKIDSFFLCFQFWYFYVYIFILWLKTVDKNEKKETAKKKRGKRKKSRKILQLIRYLKKKDGKKKKVSMIFKLDEPEKKKEIKKKHEEREANK